jgi:hypothetical protein
MSLFFWLRSNSEIWKNSIEFFLAIQGVNNYIITKVKWCGEIIVNQKIFLLWIVIVILFLISRLFASE